MELGGILKPFAPFAGTGNFTFGERLEKLDETFAHFRRAPSRNQGESAAH